MEAGGAAGHFDGPAGYDIDLEVVLNGTVVARPPFLDELPRPGGNEQVVGDGGDLLRLSPRLLEDGELALQRTPFLLLVQGHLQCQPGGPG